MSNAYDVDFVHLDVEQKIEFVNGFSKIAKSSFSKEPLKQSWIAQVLFFSRCWNSYQYMQNPNQIPKVIPRALEMMWDYLEEKISREELTLFQTGFSSSLLYLNTGDDSELCESNENRMFFETYFKEFQLFYLLFADSLCYGMEQMVQYTVTWYPIENLLYADIGDSLIEFLERVYTNPTGGYTAAELKQREQEVYSSGTFCSVVSLLQQDMKTSLKECSLSKLREDYKNEYLFPIEACKQISKVKI